MSGFEDYALDQFPFRDEFRSIKAVSRFNIFLQLDNNDIFMKNGYASKLEYPLNTGSLINASNKFRYIYEKYLKDKGSNVYLSVIPDKSYFLAEKNGYLSMDYNELVRIITANTEFSKYIDIFPELSIDDYYKTDTHWRQENLLDVITKISKEMGFEGLLSQEYNVNTLDKNFYGVYCGQSSLPLSADRIKYLTNDLFSDLIVTNLENQKKINVYDMERAFGRDPYEMFLSGPVSLITIENPNAKTDKELILFRDSFGSSIAPLFVEGYRKITLVDIRYMTSNSLDKFIEFNGQDVLFLYSTLVLNNSETLK